MKEWKGLYLPQHEEHLIGWMQKKNQVVDGRPTYQLDKIKKALSYCKQYRHAIDIGGHCGLWSMILVRHFEKVLAFEPVPEHRVCYKLNVKSENYELFPYALGEEERHVSIHTSKGSSGDSWVSGDGEIPMMRLDDLLPRTEDIDFIKADCEGFELFALRGGEELIKRCKPAICVEQKPGRAQKFGLGEIDAVKYLQSLGYDLREEVSGDFFLTYPS